jgi:hypothetical protein
MAPVEVVSAAIRDAIDPKFGEPFDDERID